MMTVAATQAQALTDEQVVERVLQGEVALFEIIMRRYNQLLYRSVRTIVRDEDEAEDVVQEAYVRAFYHLEQFEGRAKLSTWLARIAIHEALGRVQKSARLESLDENAEETERMHTNGSSPETNAAHAEMRGILEGAIERLPALYRQVFVLREVEGLDTEQAAELLEISPDNVKMRLHRARAMMRRDLTRRAGITAGELFPFPATRCDRVVAKVMARIL